MKEKKIVCFYRNVELHHSARGSWWTGSQGSHLSWNTPQEVLRPKMCRCRIYIQCFSGETVHNGAQVWSAVLIRHMWNLATLSPSKFMNITLIGDAGFLRGLVQDLTWTYWRFPATPLSKQINVALKKMLHPISINCSLFAHFYRSWMIILH